MMAVDISTLKKSTRIDKVIIHSLDCSLYQASIIIDGEEHYLTDKKGKMLRSFNLLSFQAMFQPFTVTEMVMRHQSAYDEMIGQSTRIESNAMEVPLGNSDLAADSSITGSIH